MDQETLKSELSSILIRLIPTLTHQINNSMQAVRGALTLAMEEINHPEELTAYIQLCLRESERVLQVVNQLRLACSFQIDEKETFELNQLLEETILLTSKDLERLDVNLIFDLSPEPMLINAFVSQMRLIFLHLLLDLGDAIGECGGGDLQIHSRLVQGVAQVEISTGTQFKVQFAQTPENIPSSPLDKNILLVHEIISDNQGNFEIQEKVGRTILHIDLPSHPRG